MTVNNIKADTATVRTALIAAIHAFAPGMGGLVECSVEDLLAVLVDVTDADL